MYLQNVARRLLEKLRGQDTLARVGGDEFIVLIPVVRDRIEAEEIAWRLAGTLRLALPALMGKHWKARPA